MLILGLNAQQLASFVARDSMLSSKSTTLSCELAKARGMDMRRELS
jgi:hypothetical protein